MDKEYFSPYTLIKPIEVTRTGKVYEVGEHHYYKDYKVIEVIDEYGNIHDVFEGELSEIKSKENPKKETLEEAGKYFIENEMKYSFNSMSSSPVANRMLKCVEFGAKWQQEQDNKSYSNEDVLKILIKFTNDGNDCRNLKGKEKEWFKEFKNKNK